MTVAPKRSVFAIPRSRNTLRWRETVGWLRSKAVCQIPDVFGAFSEEVQQHNAGWIGQCLANLGVQELNF